MKIDYIFGLLLHLFSKIVRCVGEFLAFLVGYVG
jgi:hypothetical protein